MKGAKNGNINLQELYALKGYINVTPDTPACDLRFRRVKYVKKPNGTIGIEEIRK